MGVNDGLTHGGGPDNSVDERVTSDIDRQGVIGDMTRAVDLIIAIENGEEDTDAFRSLTQRDNRERLDIERSTTRSSIEEMMDNGIISLDGTGNEIQQKMEAMVAELGEVFEELTCMFSGNKYGVSQDLRDVLMGCIPGYDRQTDAIEFEGGDVIFYNVGGIKIGEMKLYTFYEYFDKDVERGINTDQTK